MIHKLSRSRLQVVTFLVAITAFAVLLWPQARTMVLDYLRTQPQPVLVLAPGTEVVIAGVEYRLYGYDECPRNEGVMAFVAGDVGAPTERGCLRLDQQTVRASLKPLARGSTVEESLIVKRDQDRVSLERADGTPVIAVKSAN